MNVYETDNNLYYVTYLQKAFQNSLEGEYLAISSDSDYSTIPLEHNVLICDLTKDHVC